ncbi:MAG: proton-conducting transporter membrane subunit, partial [Pseudomonadota bacterium]
MNFTLPNLLPAYPEMFLLAMVSAILVIDLFLVQRQRYIILALSQLTLLGCAVLTLDVGFVTEGQVVYTFNNMFVSDLMGHVLKLAAYLAVSITLVYSRDYMSDRGLYKGEFFVLVLFALMGMMVMISANHFLTLYLGLELLSLSLYALVALNRDSAKSTEAAMKYFVLGALASGLLLYGMSMIYGATGT